MKAASVLIVLLSAILTAADAVLTEAVMSAFHVGALVASTLPGFVAGALLFAVSYAKDKNFYKKFDRKSLVKIVVIAALGSLAVFTWFDSVTRIGAGKEFLLSGSTSEVLFILLLSFIFLKERLGRMELVGSAFVLFGIVLVSFNPQVAFLEFGFGDMEAMLSALFFATAIIVTTDLLKKFNPQEVGAMYILIEGLILLTAVYLFGLGAEFSFNVISVSIVIGILVGMAVFTYNIGLKLAGASLTSVVASFAGIFTVGLQFLAALLLPTVAFIFPSNIPLAVGGGLLAVLGVFLISYKGK